MVVGGLLGPGLLLGGSSSRGTLLLRAGLGGVRGRIVLVRPLVAAVLTHEGRLVPRLLRGGGRRTIVNLREEHIATRRKHS